MFIVRPTIRGGIGSGPSKEPTLPGVTVHPEISPGRPAAEELAEPVAVKAKMKKTTAELKAMVLASESRLMEIRGVGAVVAARILAGVGDVARFADRTRFTSWTGTAPLDASSGKQNRHRLSRAGNRRVNHMIHIAAVIQLRLDTEGRAYYRRKRAAGKKPDEALRRLKRRISDAIYKHLVADAAAPVRRTRALRGVSRIQRGQPAPHIDTSGQPFPGPAEPTLRRVCGHPKDAAARPLPSPS